MLFGNYAILFRKISFFGKEREFALGVGLVEWNRQNKSAFIIRPEKKNFFGGNRGFFRGNIFGRNISIFEDIILLTLRLGFEIAPALPTLHYFLWILQFVYALIYQVFWTLWREHWQACNFLYQDDLSFGRLGRLKQLLTYLKILHLGRIYQWRQ